MTGKKSPSHTHSTQVVWTCFGCPWGQGSKKAIECGVGLRQKIRPQRPGRPGPGPASEWDIPLSVPDLNCSAFSALTQSSSEATGWETKASPWAHLVPRRSAEWVGSGGWTQASSPRAFGALPWCELLSILGPVPAGRNFLSAAPSPGRTRDSTWALKLGGIGYSVACPHGMKQWPAKERGGTQLSAEQSTQQVDRGQASINK